MRHLRQPNVRLCGAFVGWVAIAGSLLAADGPGQFTNGKWPFRQPTRPAVPAVQKADWVRNPIDAFVLHTLEAKGLTANGPAERLTLLRRVTFDLTGLAPTSEEQRAFLADTSQGAYERAVDRLLESPRYGERWAQHWLDIVRYSESDGFKADAHRPNAHKYRDYVIRAFNADLPYDRFLAQQLAGDELEPDNPEAQLATGLNRLYPDESNAADVRQRRQEIHDDLTDTTALALLGLTVGCAQCHDHKFDPITQVDYYRLQAFFAPLLPRDEVVIATPQERRRHAIDEAAWEEATRGIRAEMDALVGPKMAAAFKTAIEKFTPDIRETLEKPDAERTCLEKQLAVQAMQFVNPLMADVADTKLRGDDKKRYQALERQLAEFEHLKPAPLPTAMAVSDASADAPPTFRLAVGDYHKPQEEVRPGFPQFLGASEPAIESKAGGNSTGRRSALVAWMCRSDHPLTSRVMVNRIWQHHFGVGIVATPNDFGAMGEPPTHPELLDWLAVEFVERGWSVKAMHRLMATSATYRQSSAVDPDNPIHARALALDANDRLLWHARRHRLEGEAIRDAMLQLSGELELRMFGESARPELPEGVVAKGAWEPDARPSDRNRRSIYVLAKRNLRYPLLDIFDLPDLHNSCPQRSATTTAPQALTLLNGEFSLERAQRWSGRLLARVGADETALVRAALEEAFAREPDNASLRMAADFVSRQTAAISAAGDASAADVLPTPMPKNLDPARAAALVDFCHAILNTNEFVYVD
ncbi:MAG: DUF1549 and DUF1553 domain-containing protein [Pirellulales bacterium]